MASLSSDSLFLAGFTLAHAAWSVSDTTPDELLCPLAVVEEDGERRIVRFEAETQEDAIRMMKDSMADVMRDGHAFAAAREGAWRPNGPDTEPEDIITVEFWAPGMESPVSTLQPFRRARDSNGFTLLGDPMLAIDGAIVRPNDAAPAVEVVLAGVLSHPAVQPLWKGWQSGR